MAKKTKSKATESTVYVPPVIEHRAWDESPERVELFSISTPDPTGEGEPTVKTYSMPGTPNVGLGLEMLRMARLHGDMIALSWLLEEAVGPEGYTALVSEPDLDPGVLRAILFRVRDVVLGGLAAPKG